MMRDVIVIFCTVEMLAGLGLVIATFTSDITSRFANPLYFFLGIAMFFLGGIGALGSSS